MRRKYLIAGIIIVAVIAGGALYFMRDNAKASDAYRDEAGRAFKGANQQLNKTSKTMKSP